MNVDADYEALLQFMYLSPVGLIKTDLSGGIDLVNPKAAQLLLPISRTPEKLDNLFDALQQYAPEVRNLAVAFTATTGVICENHRINIQDGAKNNPTILGLTLIRIDSARLMAVLQDLTTIVEQERAIRSREQRLQAIFTSIRDYAIYTLDSGGRIETWNRSAEQVVGFAAEEAIGREYGIDYPPEARDTSRVQELLCRAAGEGWHGEEGWRVRQDGTRFWGETMISVLSETDLNSGKHGFSVITRDSSERKRAEDDLRRMANTDYLTGVYNRRHFFEVAAEDIARCLAEKHAVSVIMLDVDHFKHLNDTRGHEAGDDALRQLATACLAVLGPDDILARFGGEEFAVLLPGSDVNRATAVAERMRAGIELQPAGITASFGVAGVQDDLDAALRAADKALYQAKDQGRNRVVVA